MGEYFNWVNVNKKEYLCPADFDLGSKSRESSHKDNPLLQALYALLSTRWKGDQIIFLGDEAKLPFETPCSVLNILNKQAEPGDYFDYICVNYRNASGLFKEAEEQVREAIADWLIDRQSDRFDYHNEYGIDLQDPYAGLFILYGKSFSYIVNHSKRVYYSPEKTRISYSDGVRCGWLDPLPILMGYGRSVNTGLWLGDVIGVSNEVVPDYNFLPEMTLDINTGDLFIQGFEEAANKARFVFEWKDEFAPLILMRGKKYFESGNVRRIQCCGNTYFAEVAGAEDYEVEITIGEDGIEDMDCTCPYAQGDDCKHMAAVLFALESGNASVEELPPAKRPPIVSHVPVEIPWLEAIDHLPEVVVRKELQKQADRDQRLKERLAVLYLGKLPEGQLQNWKASLQEKAAEYTDRIGRIKADDVWEFMNELGNFLATKLPLLCEVKAVMDAFHLTWIVMETALEWTLDDRNNEIESLFADCEEALRKIFSMSTEAQKEQILQWYQEHRNEEWPGDVKNMDRVFSSATQPKPQTDGKRVMRIFDRVPCFLCEGEWVAFPKRYHIYYDFIEETEIYKETKPIIEEMIKQRLGELYGRRGACNVIWPLRKQLLMEQYGIEWFTPKELNPCACFD